MPEHIQTRPATPEYREGWERIFGNKQPDPAQPSKLTPFRKPKAKGRVANTGLRPDEFSL